MRPDPNKKKRAPQSSADHLPPHSPADELGAIGCVLYSVDRAGDVLNTLEEAGVQPEWFYDVRLQIIYAAMQTMHRAGQPVDVITLHAQLQKTGGVDAAGDLAFITTLQDATPSPANVSSYVERVREQFRRRKVIQLGVDVVARAYDPEQSAEQLTDELTRDILKLSEEGTVAGEHRIKEVILRVIDELEDYHRGRAQIRGLTTGIEYLDKLLLGIGGKNGNYFVLSGRPGTGKTSFATQIAMHVSLDHVWWDPILVDGKPVMETLESGREVFKCERKVGLPVAIFSLEMAEEALVQRMLFQRAGADMQRWRTGFAEGDGHRKLTLAAAALSKPNNIFVDDKSRCTVESLRARARRMHRQHGIRLFIIDYIQLIRSGNKSGRQDRVQELNDISGEIQALGKELNVPFIVLAQMNRDYEKDPNRAPRLADLKDCGAIEQDADLVGFLFKPKLKEEAEEIYDNAMAAVYGSDKEDWVKYPLRVDLLIAKNRYGPSDKYTKLLFEGACTRFLDYTVWLKENGHKQPAAGERRPRITPQDLPSNEEMDS